jgi:hypothetical protein
MPHSLIYFKSLSDGMKTLEDELESYKWKTHQLQDAIASPSADKKNSAINRLFLMPVKFKA